MRRDRILITKELIPYTFNILLGNTTYALTINYNENHDFFTVKMQKDRKTLCEGEPIIYGFPLFGDLYQRGEFPSMDIVPIDESGERNTVTFENFNETVFLTIDNFGGDEVE